MTEDEIRKMRAGQELDNLIAAHVFEREVCPIHLSLYCCGRDGGHWSTDIAAAWQVVEKMVSDQYEFRLWGGHPYWEVEFLANRRGGFPSPSPEARYSVNKNPAFAICHAALLAVMSERNGH